MARSVAPETTIQTAVFQIEIGRGRKIMQWLLLILLAAALSLVYTAGQFRGLNKRESMDMAQLARNLAHGQGFTTYVIRPLSLWQLEQNGWNIQDKATRARLIMNHPDICNPPLYPMVLAGLFKILPGKGIHVRLGRTRLLPRALGDPAVRPAVPVCVSAPHLCMGEATV